MNKEKILVTGAAGFIGFHLCKSLLDDGVEIYGIDTMNDYYDPDLKQARLDHLMPYDNFSFSNSDISNLIMASSLPNKNSASFFTT